MKRTKIIGIIIFISLVIWATIYSTNEEYIRILKYDFQGKVKKVKYDAKGIPYVTINQMTYYLSYKSWPFDHNVEVGNMLEKYKNTTKITLIKRKTQEVIIYPNHD